MLTTRTLFQHEELKKKKGSKQTILKLRQLINEIDNKIRQVPPKRQYNYQVLKWLLRDTLQYLLDGKKVTTKTTYILPGALWIVKSLLKGRLTIDTAAMYIDKIRFLTRKMLRELIFNRNLELVIPSNLSLRDIKIYAWVDKVGCDQDGNPLYILTMYFSFPFDINELDRRSEYEPVSFLFVKKNGKFVPLKAYARVHYDIYVYDVEKMKNIKILFMRFGHTPKIKVSEVARITTGNIPKEILDKLWLIIGEFITKLSGTKTIRLRDARKNLHVYVKYKLPKTIVNPFTSPIHPYFVDIGIIG